MPFRRGLKGREPQAQPAYGARSLWLDQLSASLVPRARLPGDVDCDVAIVGAGFTGLWAAYYLMRAQPDLRIVVVEREIAGFGPSGRNGGWAAGGIAGSPSGYGLVADSDVVHRAVRATNEAVDEIGRVADDERIECGFRKAGMLVIATSSPQWRRLTASADRGLLEPDGRLLSASEAAKLVGAEGLLGGWYQPHAARIDPARLVRGLADACERHGATIYERTNARSLEPGRVHCDSGTVRAEVVLQATESYSTQLRGQRRRYLPIYSLMIATAPLGPDVWDALRWREGLLVCDRRHLFFYAQRTADDRIAIGGRGAPYWLASPFDQRNERNPAVRERLTETLRREFPAAGAAEITHHWGGPLAVPRDWSMSVTFDRPTGIGFAGGYTGHGVGAANISGRTLADLVLRNDSELAAMPWVDHASPRWEPEPIRFLASRAITSTLTGADRHEDATGRPARRIRLIRPFLPPG
jgi:glycine/D-amino acid oxidase-like deaminating enzyme